MIRAKGLPRYIAPSSIALFVALFFIASIAVRSRGRGRRRTAPTRSPDSEDVDDAGSTLRAATTPDTSIAVALEALAAGDSQRAESVSRAHLEVDPRSVDHLRLLARALTVQSRLEEAEQTLRRALALRPEFRTAA